MKKTITIFLFILSFLISQGAAYAAGSTTDKTNFPITADESGRVYWNGCDVTKTTTVVLPSKQHTANSTVEKDINVQLKGQITVKSGYTLTIKMDKASQWTRRGIITIASTFSGNCMFLIENGASLVLEGIDSEIYLGMKGANVSSNLPAMYDSSTGTWTKPNLSQYEQYYQFPAGYGMITTKGNLTMNHVRMYDAYSNTAGAAIVVQQNTTNNLIKYGKVKLTDCRISNCIAEFGPALIIYNQINNPEHYNTTQLDPENSSVTLENCQIKNCYSTSDNACGTIRTGGTAYSHLKLTNTTISGNYAEGSSAGIAWNAHGLTKAESVLTLDGCTIENNYSVGPGAALHLASSFQFTNNTTYIRNNTSNSNGGGMYIKTYTSNAAKRTAPQELNMSLNEYAIVTGNKAKNGAGIYIEDSSATDLGDDSELNLSIDGAVISNNESTANGGGIYFYGDNSTVYFNIFLNIGTIKRNKAVNGGGFYGTGGSNLDKDRVSINFNGGEISESEVTGNGGGIYVDGLNIDCDENVQTGLALSGNHAKSGDGGGMYVTGNAKFDMYSGNVYGNTASGEGGGLYMTGDSQVNIYGGRFENNKAVNGAGLFQASGTLKIAQNSVITSNASTTNGGGIYIKNQSKFTLSNGEISYNEADTYGAGIYVSGCSSFLIENGTIAHNTIDNYGGGLCFSKDANDVKIRGGEIHHNTATTDHGGGIFSYVPLDIDGGVIYNNKANLGGGIYLSGATASLDLGDGTIRDNTAASHGGGIYVFGSEGVSLSGTISGNKAVEGGGLYANSGSITISGGDIENNTVTRGGGVLLAGSASLVFNGGNVSGNTAVYEGAGLYLKEDATCNFSNGNVHDNVAAMGGGVYMDGSSQMTFSDGIIRGNKAETDRSGFGTAYNNSEVRGAGGGIFLTGSAQFTFDPDSSVGLFGNEADQVGDDLVMASSTAKVVLPNVSDMTLTDYDTVTSELFWVEDYMTGDTAYSSGTNQAGNGYSAIRYQQIIQEQGTVYAVPAGTYTGKYLALSLGHEIIYVTIVRSGLLKGENAIYRVYRQDGNDVWTWYAEVVLLGPSDATATNASSKSVSKRVALYSGTWKVEEVGWAWSYKYDNALVHTVNSSSSALEKSFVFTGAKLAPGDDKYMPQKHYGESVVTNDFGTGTVQTGNSAPPSSSSFETITPNGVGW